MYAGENTIEGNAKHDNEPRWIRPKLMLDQRTTWCIARRMGSVSLVICSGRRDNLKRPSLSAAHPNEQWQV